MGGIKLYSPDPMSLIRDLLLCIKALNDVIDRYQVRGYTDWHQTRADPGCREKGEKHMCREPNPNIPQFFDVGGYKLVTVLAQNERGPARLNNGRRRAGPSQKEVEMVWALILIISRHS